MKNRWKHGLLWLLMLCFMVVFPAGTASAASSKSVEGTCDYDYAYQVLTLVNQQRSKAGLKSLKMDSELLKAAMLRAAECTVKFDHTRPNGTMCYTACSKMYGENIALGYGTPTAVMQGWMGSANHKKNILNGDYNSIGIGCFYKNGTRYWVQCFGFAKGNGVSNPGNCKNTYEVATSSSGETKLTKSVKSNPLSTKVSGFKATGGKRKLTLKWSSKGGITGYQLQVATAKSYKNPQTYSISKKSTSKTITKYKGKKLKAKKRYYVRIRAYIKSKDANGKIVKKYSKWKTLNAKTK